ncbi:hypothetical protein EJ110_NYTH32489 [Nymphaea thermarum]|nr:hypothetical protein EJ110_NYTH32489 [Nymphaea thermarum]
MWLCVSELSYLRHWSRLFEAQAVQGPRVLLCDVLGALGSRLPNLSVLGKAGHLSLEFTHPWMSTLPLQRVNGSILLWATTGVVSRLWAAHASNKEVGFPFPAPIAQLQIRFRAIENGFKTWLSKQSLPVEAAIVTATSAAQGAAIGAFMGTLTADVSSSLPVPPQGAALNPQAMASLQQAQNHSYVEP